VLINPANNICWARVSKFDKRKVHCFFDEFCYEAC
jgi:hypothetical protein